MHQDGLWELTFALFLFAWFARDVTGIPLVGIGLIFAGVLIFVLGKWFITVPRMGMVRFGPARRRKRWQLIWLLAAGILATYALLVLTVGRDTPWLRENQVGVGIGVALFLVVVFSAIAHQLDCPRFYFFGAVFAVAELASLGLDTPLVPLTGSVVLLIPGVVALVGFQRRYPPTGGKP